MRAFSNRRFMVFITVLLAAGLLAPAFAHEGFSHRRWTSVLKRFVDDRGHVDYRGLAANPGTFDAYVEQIAEVGPESHPEKFPTRDDALAYYINAYNALVFRGVLERGPDVESVWGNVFQGYRFFVGTKYVVGGRKIGLKKLEDSIIREQFGDPRIHAALNCASAGCPRLPQEAFDPHELDAQLDAAMAEFVGDERNCSVDDSRRKVTLSKIFDWFRGDFLDYEKARGTEDPSLIDYVNRYRPEDLRIPRDYSIDFAPYDKKLNAQ